MKNLSWTKEEFDETLLATKCQFVGIGEEKVEYQIFKDEKDEWYLVDFEEEDLYHYLGVAFEIAIDKVEKLRAKYNNIERLRGLGLKF